VADCVERTETLCVRRRIRAIKALQLFVEKKENDLRLKKSPTKQVQNGHTSLGRPARDFGHRDKNTAIHSDFAGLFRIAVARLDSARRAQLLARGPVAAARATHELDEIT